MLRQRPNIDAVADVNEPSTPSDIGADSDCPVDVVANLTTCIGAHVHGGPGTHR